MVRLLVMYAHPTEPEAFDTYYRTVHLGIARYFADLFAESRAAMEAILASHEGQAAVSDVPKFATGGVTFLYSDVEKIV